MYFAERYKKSQVKKMGKNQGGRMEGNRKRSAANPQSKAAQKEAVDKSVKIEEARVAAEKRHIESRKAMQAVVRGHTQTVEFLKIFEGNLAKTKQWSKEFHKAVQIFSDMRLRECCILREQCRHATYIPGAVAAHQKMSTTGSRPGCACFTLDEAKKLDAFDNKSIRLLGDALISRNLNFDLAAKSPQEENFRFAFVENACVYTYTKEKRSLNIEITHSAVTLTTPVDVLDSKGNTITEYVVVTGEEERDAFFEEIKAPFNALLADGTSFSDYNEMTKFVTACISLKPRENLTYNKLISLIKKTLGGASSNSANSQQVESAEQEDDEIDPNSPLWLLVREHIRHSLQLEGRRNALLARKEVASAESTAEDVAEVKAAKAGGSAVEEEADEEAEEEVGEEVGEEAEEEVGEEAAVGAVASRAAAADSPTPESLTYTLDTCTASITYEQLAIDYDGYSMVLTATKSQLQKGNKQVAPEDMKRLLEKFNKKLNCIKQNNEVKELVNILFNKYNTCFNKGLLVFDNLRSCLSAAGILPELHPYCDSAALCRDSVAPCDNCGCFDPATPQETPECAQCPCHGEY